MKPLVIYLHGFRSSPASSKAQNIGHWLAAEGVAYACPALDISPAIAIEQAQACIDQGLAQGLAPRLIGSSLGGFYATHLMETHPARAGFKAALLNPACLPERDLKDQVGSHPAWHSDEVLHFLGAYLDVLREQTRTPTDLQRYCLLAAKGDELLDWREMAERYAGAEQRILEGSDHGLSDFDQHWPWVRDFLLR